MVSETDVVIFYFFSACQVLLTLKKLKAEIFFALKILLIFSNSAM